MKKQSKVDRKVLIVGATSAIAHETAKLFANDGTELFLVGRSSEKLAAVRDDLIVRGSKRVATFLLDVNEVKRHEELVDSALRTLGRIDIVFVAHGTLGDQEMCGRSVTETLNELNTNCISVISLLTILANYFEEQKRGMIVVITSVAGDRGRKSNYVYGTAKGAVNIFLQGLRNRLHRIGVSVVTIKPGFVDTPMTASMKKNFLLADPRSVGKGIYRAIGKGKDVAYIPWFWHPIMALVRSIPETVFKRLEL